MIIGCQCHDTAELRCHHAFREARIAPVRLGVGAPATLSLDVGNMRNRLLQEGLCDVEFGSEA